MWGIFIAPHDASKDVPRDISGQGISVGYHSCSASLHIFFFQDCRKLSVCSVDSVSYLVLLAEVCRSANGNCQAVIAGSRSRALGRSRQKSA
jgi:hypothetical protein